VDCEEDEGFVDQIGFMHKMLTKLASQILAGKDIVLIEFKNGEWWEVAIPQYIIDELQPEAL